MSDRWLGRERFRSSSITFIIVSIAAGTHHSTVAWGTKSPRRYRSIANRPGPAGGSSEGDGTGELGAGLVAGDVDGAVVNAGRVAEGVGGAVTAVNADGRGDGVGSDATAT